MTPIRVAANDFDAFQVAGWYQVELDGFVLEFYFKPSTISRAYVFSPGWMNRATSPHPYFQRVKWLAELEGIGISLADPTLALNDEVQIGWFVGPPATDYSRLTADYLRRLFIHLGVPADQTVFFGSSAGGFASLAFATHVRGASVLAFNPQTDILRFHDVNELSKMTRTTFGRLDSIKIRRQFSSRVSIAALWKTEGYVPPGLIMANTYDPWHIENHIAPLLASLSLSDIGGSLEVRFISDPEAGHNPPGPRILLPILRDMGSRVRPVATSP